MKVLTGFLTAFSIPLMVLNVLGGITSGVWLVVLRDWNTLGLGVGLFIGSTLILGFALMPSMLLAAPAAYFAERGKTIGLVLFGALGSLYTLALITVWCCGALFLFVKDASAASLIPRLIWSYGVATGPWASMALKEEGPEDQGSAATFAAFLAQPAYLVIMLLVIFSSITWIGALRVFGAFMLIALAIQMAVFVMYQRERFAGRQVLKE